MMKPLIFLAVLVCCCCSLFGQQQGSGEFIISGTILEPQDQQPIEYATVVVKSNETEKIITGTTSGTGGRFSVRTDNRDIYLEISFIGYVTQSIRDLVFEGREVDLGAITLSLDDQLLDEVTVIGEKSTTEFELDKRVFNVGKDG